MLCGGEESSQNLFQGGRVVCGGHILPVSVRQKGKLWNSLRGEGWGCKKVSCEILKGGRGGVQKGKPWNS